MSANTGIAFQHRIAVAEAHIVQGLTITSSPGLIPAAPMATISPDVAELTVTACVTLNSLSLSRSNY